VTLIAESIHTSFPFLSVATSDLVLADVVITKEDKLANHYSTLKDLVKSGFQIEIAYILDDLNLPTIERIKKNALKLDPS